MDRGHVAQYYTHCPPIASARLPAPYHGTPNAQVPGVLQPYHPYQPMGNSTAYQPRTIEAFSTLPHALEHGSSPGPPIPIVNSNYAYFIDRGEGRVARLVPADMLPPLVGILPQELRGPGMHVLPALYGKPPAGARSMNVPIVVKDPLDGSFAHRKTKEYCDHWVHTGDCRFQQQGCRFKHEMPQDRATQERLGLTHGLPRWWRLRFGSSNKSAEPAKSLRPEWRQNAAHSAERQPWEKPSGEQKHDIRRGSLPLSGAEMAASGNHGAIGGPSKFKSN